MIENEQQYKVTQNQRQMLAQELDRLPSGADFLLGLQRASLEGQIADLDHEIAEYDELRGMT